MQSDRCRVPYARHEVVGLKRADDHHMHNLTPALRFRNCTGKNPSNTSLKGVRHERRRTGRFYGCEKVSGG